MQIRRVWFLLIVFSLRLPLTTEAVAAKKPNVLLICVDDLRPELACFGKDYIRSPNIDALAARGRAFHRHYVQAPTCGASRYALLTGTYGPSGNGALFSRGAKVAKDPEAYPPSFPAWFRQNGYTTVSVGKVSHHPGGRGGKDWDQDSIPEMPLSWDRHLLPAGLWQHPRGAMHGLANGEIRSDASKMALFQAVEGPDSIYPDGLIVDEALSQLDQLTTDKEDRPFFLAVGIIRPHLPFGAPKKYLDLYEGVELPPIPHPNQPEGKTTWHRSGEFMKYNRWNRNPNTDADFATEVRRHYAACVSYADAQVGRVIAKLNETREAGNTIVVLWGDHGWHLGEHAIWGKHALFEESLHSPLIISYPDMPLPGEQSDSMVETIDVFPSVCEIAGLPKPDFVDGVSLQSLIDNPDGPGHSAIAYARARTIRTDTHRLVAHKDGYNELYDHRTAEGETRNVASEQPEVVEALRAELDLRLEGDSKFVPGQASLPVKAPKDAIVLSGNDGSHNFLSMAGERPDWPFEDGTLTSTKGKGRTNHIVSKQHFRDADIHVEFMLPESGTGNSGIYIHGNYELQIFNSVDAKKLSQQEMGAIYGFSEPLVNASRKPGEWQVYDIRYRAPRRDRTGKILTEGSITAWLNGQKVQDETRLGEPRSKYHPFRYGTTPYLKKIAQRQLETSVGPLFLQDHDNPVQFRNVWIRPLDKLAFVYEPSGDDRPTEEEADRKPLSVRVVKDVSYLGKDRSEKLDLYLPEDDGKVRRPAVLIVHGGGWHGGDKAAGREQNIGNTLAAAGYVCASINYRLSVKSDDLATRLRDVWPHNLHDCKRAVQFLRTHAEKYRIDSDHIGAIGGSACGHLVAMMAFTGAEDGLEPLGPYKALSTRIQAVVPMYGVHDVVQRAKAKGSDLSESDAELCRQASPISYVSKDDPPALILHGTKDALVPVEQSKLLQASLKSADVPVSLVVIEGAPHSFHLQPKQQDLRSRVVNFFDQHLRNEEPDSNDQRAIYERQRP